MDQDTVAVVDRLNHAPPRRLHVRVCSTGLSTEQARQLRGSTDLTRGILAVPAPAGVATANVLATRILDALGATGSLRLVGRVPDAAVESVLPWLLAYRARHLMLTRADRMPATLLLWMLDLAAAAGATLWVTGVPLSSGHWQVLEGQRLVRLPAEEFCAAWDAAIRVPQQPQLTDYAPSWRLSWPPMPPDDFPTFRSAFHRRLTSPVREEADALFLDTYARSRAVLRPLLTGADTAVRAAAQDRADVIQLDRAALEQHISRYLHALIAECATTPELTVRLRAAQVAAFRLGWLLSVNLDLDGPAAVPLPPPGRHLCPGRPRARQRHHQTLPTGAVTLDGATVTAHGHQRRVPPSARVLLQAQHLIGQLTGRGPNTPFVFAPGATITHERIRSTVRAALLDAGVPLLSRKVDSTWSTNDWLNRWGIALQEVS